MTKLLPAILLLVIAFPLFKYEWNRYHELYNDCMVQWVQNEHILENELCQNAASRVLHGSKVNALCTEAERENRSHPKARAFQMWWKSSEAVALYSRVAGSTWIVLGIVLFTIAFGIYFATQYYITESREKRYFGAMTDFVAKLGPKKDNTMALEEDKKRGAHYYEQQQRKKSVNHDHYYYYY